MEHVLPVAPYRQYTVSLPKRVRWHLARNDALVSQVLAIVIRLLFGFQRKQARALGFEGKLEPAAVAFVQRFGSALQLNVHLHLLLPDGVFGAEGELLALPPPSHEDVVKLLDTLVR